MFKNGVTHAVVNDDFEGICKIIQWMSYLPDEVRISSFLDEYRTESIPICRLFTDSHVPLPPIPRIRFVTSPRRIHR